jgi:hypothetical protein
VTPEGLLVKSAETGQIREIDSASKGKHRLKQLLQEAALPNPNLAVVNVSHLPENGGYHRREKRLWEHRPSGLVRLVTNQTLRPIAFSCKSGPNLHGVLSVTQVVC